MYSGPAGLQGQGTLQTLRLLKCLIGGIDTNSDWLPSRRQNDAT